VSKTNARKNRDNSQQ